MGVGEGKLAIGQLSPAALEESHDFHPRERRADDVDLQGRTASLHLTSFGQGQVCGLQPLRLLADVLLH